MHFSELIAGLLALAVSGAAGAAGADKPATSFPYTPGLDVTSMDRSADPCTDFYQYACGGWQTNNPIPPDQPSWSVYGKLYQDNQRYLWGILESLAPSVASRDADQQKIGDFFHACMDEASVESLGAKPLLGELQTIDALRARSELPALLGELHQSTGDSGLFFGLGSSQDFEDSSQVIAYANAGGLGLPDRDYYLKQDTRSRTIRTQYLHHVESSFILVGETPAQASSDAHTVMALETRLAAASLTRVERRDPYKTVHEMNVSGLQALTPTFSWESYLTSLGIHDVPRVNVAQPRFYEALNREWGRLPLRDIKIYLRWHLIHARSPYLSAPFVNENFQFYGKTLRGVPELRARWKRCVSLVDGQLGEALGKEFVARAFSPELKAKTLRMSDQIEHAMADEIAQLDWMTGETKSRALQKLHAVVNKIGYPDRWRDYSTFDVKADDFYGNVVRGERFESHRDLAKIGKPVDRAEWEMSPPTVNAYYDWQLNTINFPAGVLQPPLFDPAMDDAPNYGNTGGTIGHELTHGFDDQGRKFDANGNLKDWWSTADSEQFQKRAQCIVDQYSSYTVVDDVHINGRLTLGEDIADLGGLILAWTAWKAQAAGAPLQDRDGLNPDQRFFVGYAQWACENVRPEDARLNAATDPHSPGIYRVNGLVVNMPQFRQAFSCAKGTPMTSENICRVW